ncbi:unnamed protein product [Rotaria socialis]|uniref:B30.2/SPRY domain-containing protein n=1 Tax=Rotaria socialis TaxID=392032 RepID=A0A818SAA9_9BILA|nr:unnamed protein product [Rotaria socialis]CAF4709508.1 unnamed protein product [Rotaria socialis]
MGQQLFKVHLDINDKIQVDSETILSIACKDDINFFLPLKSSGRNIIASDLNVGHQIPNAHAESVKEIRNDLALLTELIEWQAMNTKINDILTSDVFTILSDQNKKLIADINDYLAYKQSLEKCLMEKLKDDSNDNTSILAYSFVDYSSSHATSSSTKTEDQKSQKAKYLSKQLSYLAIQSLTSILLVLIKSAEKNDPSIVHHILTLAGELCQQFPMKCLSPANIFLFKSLKPLINYIHELSLTEDSIISKQATIILLAFSIAKGSFKDILSLLNKLIFNTTDIYNVQGLFIQLNNGLEETLNDAEKQTASSEETEDATSIGYLKSIGSFPNTQLTTLNEQLFTGQFISSILLSYIDIENRANLLTEEIELSSFSCEFHPSTFKNLFNIIEQLAAILPSSQSSNTIKHILTICLRLFSAHIKILSDIKTDNTNIDLSKFIIDDDLKKWFDLLFKLACSENSEQLNMSKEASKVLINIINIQSSVLTEKISLIHQYIVENKSPILTEQFLIELNNNEILTNWIDTLCDENKRNSLIQILYSFIDLYFNRPDEQKLLIEKLLLSFQQNLLSRLIHRCENKTLPNDELSLSSLIAEYLTHMFNNCLLKVSHVNNLLSSILIGLCSMTKLDEIFVYEIVQPIFLAVLPLLAEYYLKNLEHEYHELICYILGKMSHLLIIGSPQDSLEIKHSNQLKLAIFAGGYINGKNTSLLNSNLAVYSKFPSVYETEDDKDFLMSIYNNIDDGAKLISKLQMSIKHKQRLLQKSIEQQAHDACAAVFAVYIKFYWRINLAKYELSRTDPTNPHNELISIYEYANHVSTLFSTVKAQGGDCDELLKQIKMKTLFLLSSVKESSLIPIINEQMPSIIINMIPDNTLRYQRQHSRWTKANHVIKLLRNLLQACFRFRNSILRKKQLNEQKCNFESLLHHAIDHFIYEDCHKISSSINNEEKQSKIDEIETCLRRQQERAVTRLIAYRFIRTFLQNVLNENNNSQHLTIVSIYLPYLVENDLEWSYLKNISASNNQLQEEIGSCYYSIIQLVLSLCFKSDSLLQKLFYLLNLPYEIIDLCQLYQYEFVQTLFKSFVSFKQTSEHETSLNLKFISFNWFRLYIFKLCGNVEMERQKGILNEILEEQEKLAFNTSILNELKDLIKQSNEESAIDSQEQKKISLSNITHCWFIQADENSDADDNDESSASHKHEIELYKSQYLVLLLQCTYYYKHVLMVCANIDYLRELLNIYHNSQLSLTRILTIKLLGSLIPRIPDTVDDQSKYLIKKFLTDVLNSIGENKISEELLAELIYMYRTIMSLDSSWKIMATTLVLDSVKLYLNLESIELNDSERMNKLLAAVCILGEYIEPFRLGSIVTVNANKKLNDESSLALIIEIDSNFGETEKYYLIQYFQTRQTETVSIDKLKLEINVSPPNLSNLEESFLDVLGYFIQIDTSTSQSLILLELKRRSISVLYNILNDRKLAEIFMKKPYASTIAKLCVCDSLEKIRQLSPDLDLSTKENLERYSLTLDTGEIFESMTEDESKDVLDHSISTNNHDDSLYTIWNTDDFKPDELIMNNLSKPISKSNTWKPYASEIEMDFVKQGRSGKDEVVIVPTPLHSVALDAIQECGTKHRFRGKIAPTSQTARVSFPSFIADNLQLSEGNWYFCVRLPLGGVVQIGWATNGFSPSIGCGVGDDRFSWSYDGSRAAFFYEEGFYGQYDNTHWGQNAVCGCGIEIDGLNTRIKFWLNGKYLGTAFQHDTFVPLSTKTCNLLPNGPKTKFFPGVTMQYGSDPSIYCELIFSPEDMESCPLPNGYKPLLLPKCVLTENSIVEYPFSAYLIGENPEDFVYSTRANSSVVLLRDFMYQHHLENKFSFDNHHLILSEQSTGFPLSIDNDDMTSLTISFDFQILTSNEKSDILLFKIESTEIIVNITNETIRCTIVFLAKKRRIKVYINNKCRLFIDAFQRETIKKLNLNLLPTIAAKIRNLAIWKYALAEGDIRRLFTYGLFYIAVENQRLREHRQQANTISFSKNQTNFTDECLIPFNESFKEDVWTKKKTQADDNESNYFKTNNDIDYSVVELLGNQTYLVLDKSIEEWNEYTIVLNISISNWPLTSEKLTLIIFNPKYELYITHEGKLCLDSNGIVTDSVATVALNDYVNLFISVQEKAVKIYLNRNLEIDVEISDDQYHIKSNRIDLFREIDLKKNTTSDCTVRVSLKSITYLNHSIPIDQHVVSSLITPSISILGTNLTAMGYKKAWIDSVIKQYNTTDIPTIHKILYEQKDQFIKLDLENERKHYLTILSKLDPLSDVQALKDLIYSSKLNTDQSIIDLAKHVFTQSISSHALQTLNNSNNFELYLDNQWFPESIQHLNIDDNINGWILDKSSIETDQNNQYHLFDFNKTEEKSKISKKSEGSDKTISSTKSLISRTDCEHGLTTIYARCTILNMIKLWLYDQTSLFPLEKFGDFPFVIKLLRLLDSMQIDIDEKDDRINLLINSILKSEMKNLLESKITVDEHLLESKSPLFYHLQKHIFIQSIQLVSKPSLFDQNSNGKTSINEQQPDFAFVLKVLKLFMELVRARSSLEQNQIESIISLLFPTQLINLAFDLFLLVPVHQSKIAIIHLFTTLLQTSEQLILNNEIQQFFFQLLIELSSKAASLSNYSLKHLQLALADFIFILITKLKHLSNENSGKIKVIETKLPENIQNLYTIIDVINIWTDPKREKILPEKFLLKSDNYKISQEDFTNSNNHFNTIADQDLINFMNNELLANDSFSKFIEKLPKESPADSTFFKNHLSLTNIPADCIRIRAQFFYSFNTLLTETLSIVDFSLPLGESFLTDRIRIIKPYLLSTTKFGLFQESLDNTESDQNTEWTLVNFDTLKASTDISNSENTMFYQAYQQMRNNAHIIFRRPNEQLWHAQYIGMHSTDHGGPYRDSITRICSDICSTRLPLFILCPNGRTNSGLNRDCWIPNVFPPHESIENTITKQYRFVGQLLGMAIRRKHYLNVKFPSLLWKQLSNEPITVEDIEAIDSQSFTIINEAEKNIEQIRSVTAAGAESDVDSLFSSIMSELRFDVVSSSGQTYELIPDGSNIPITVENFKQYCKYYRQYRLNEFNRQIDFIRQGLHNIVPCYYLSLLTANELEEATCGKDRIDIELLQRHACYGGCYSEESPPIERFWKVLNEMFNEDQKKALLIFAWGRSTLPIRDEDFDMKFCISEFDVYDGEVDKTLPRSHTCFFTIDLPAYSTTDIMYERLNYAISSCSSIDGDGTVNEAHSSENGDLYNSSDDE